MVHFHYSNSQLQCDKKRIAELATEIGTPFYLYSRRTYLESLAAIKQAFDRSNITVCYALKANSNPDILKDLAARGAGADVVSVGELRLALAAGMAPENIVFAGVGKRDDEILAALDAGILGINVESEAELRVIDGLAGERGQVAPVALRINPDIDIHGHPYISTGRQADKFGISIPQATSLLHEIRQYAHVHLVGLHSHIGSQIAEIAPFQQIGTAMAELVAVASSAGHQLRYVDLGGGLGVRYHGAIPVAAHTEPVDSFAIAPREAAAALLKPLEGFGGRIVFEPGRALVAAAGALVTTVLYIKETQGKRFAVVDAGMNDLIRPSLYKAHHQVVPVRWQNSASRMYDIVGPICESGDFLGKECELPPLERGEVLALMTAGAYGFTLASNYNARPRPPEVIVDGDQFKVSRARENLGNVWKP